MSSQSQVLHDHVGRGQGLADLVGPTPLLKALYEGTKWGINNEGTLAVCTIPKIFPVFFGMDIVRGSLFENEKAKILL